MRDFSISVDIKASPERVWHVMTDGERWHEWTPSVSSVEPLDKPIAVGSRAIIRQPELPPTKFRVTALERGKSFTWSTGYTESSSCTRNTPSSPRRSEPEPPWHCAVGH